MAIRVRANMPVFGLDRDEVAEFEPSPRLDGAIEGGYLTVLADDPAPAAAAEVPAGESSAAMGTDAALSMSVAAVPPRSGKGSGAAEWRRFLRGQGVQLTDRIGGLDQADKFELIAAWDAEAERRGLAVP